MPGIDDPGSRGDTVMGHDMWTGYDALVMPGVKTGNGAIVAARAVVGTDVPPCTIVAGNPARPVRTHSDDGSIARLQEPAWRDWPVETLTRPLHLITDRDLDALAAVARGH